MKLKQVQSKLFPGATTVLLTYLALAILWVSVSPYFLGVEHKYTLTGGVVAIIVFGALNLLILVLLNKKLRLHQQEMAKRSDKNFQHFVDEIPANVAIISKDGYYKYWSHAFQKNIMSGLSGSEISEICVLAENYKTLQTDGHPYPDAERPIIRAMKTGEKITGATAGISTGLNQWAWVELTITPRKDIDGGVLDYLCLFDSISGTRVAETDLTIQTFQDTLTGLPNRSLFTELVSRAVLRTRKNNGRVGIMFLDLNRFKIVNDTLGHKMGDNLLIQVSKRLRSAVKHGDTLARLGGDEFAIMFEDMHDLSEAVMVSDWIKNAFEEPFVLNDEDCYMSCSFGLAVTNRPDVTAAEIIRDAEVAMYRAKSKGQDSLEIYDKSMNDQTRDRIKTESEMRHALHRNEFLLYYQPLINLRTGKISGWESLIRWQHPERGLVPPVLFINIAEETGMIIPLGAWILDEACRQSHDWRTRFPDYSESMMNVNLSMRQFQQQHLQEKIVGVLTKQGMDPRYLKLEITESATMKDPASSLTIMKTLKALDIKLAIDDFGTDYSSFSYLKRMPVDTLKIDKSFVDGLGLDKESTAIVQAIISMAKAMELTVTAEGIENSDQLALLREMGCDIGQGYLFSRPVPPADAEKLMAKNPVW